jgi:hypothetical protein
MVESVMLNALPAIPMPNLTVSQQQLRRSASRLMRYHRTQVSTEQTLNFDVICVTQQGWKVRHP